MSSLSHSDSTHSVPVFIRVQSLPLYCHSFWGNFRRWEPAEPTRLKHQPTPLSLYDERLPCPFATLPQPLLQPALQPRPRYSPFSTMLTAHPHVRCHIFPLTLLRSSGSQMGYFYVRHTLLDLKSRRVQMDRRVPFYLQGSLQCSYRARRWLCVHLNAQQTHPHPEEEDQAFWGAFWTGEALQGEEVNQSFLINWILLSNDWIESSCLRVLVSPFPTTNNQWCFSSKFDTVDTNHIYHARVNDSLYWCIGTITFCYTMDLKSLAW